MLTKSGPKVIEYNARFGDPETQVVLPLLETDLLDILLASLTGELENVEVKWKDKSAVCVIMSSAGYPGPFEKGQVIKVGTYNLSDYCIPCWHHRKGWRNSNKWRPSPGDHCHWRRFEGSERFGLPIRREGNFYRCSLPNRYRIKGISLTIHF